MFDDRRDEGVRWRAVARASALLLGSLVAVVGFVAATASLVAGFGVAKPHALRFGVLFGGVSLLAGFLALFGQCPDAARSGPLAGVGTAVAGVGVVLFWTAEWSGRVGQLPTVAIGTYALGVLTLFGAGFRTTPSDDEGETDRRGSDTLGGSVESVVTATEEERASDGDGSDERT
ncbi:hypothetical protein M0R88_17135 [Halorussus gelatinilyticus]|uniref:Cell division protein A N-terminal domain-containing protein n=1 Tax=Halorussus gelatinilyticus TaxID=2937524 RepID=A0A8U0IGW6_9EURY|nr:hypothetical protein [Halorussus gelatinilyticus]UPW00223.1 hypothetical protein M0R88_17135 [Halorussus gelatinilyticus]